MIEISKYINCDEFIMTVNVNFFQEKFYCSIEKF